MDSLLYRSQILTCYSMFELSIYPLVKELCKKLNLLFFFLDIQLFNGWCTILFLLFRNNLSLMSKVIIIIIKDLLLN